MDLSEVVDGISDILGDSAISDLKANADREEMTVISNLPLKQEEPKL